MDHSLPRRVAGATGRRSDITEGQLVLHRGLHQKGILPPVDVLPSLSRLMNNGIGPGRARDDHRDWANQLYAGYANGIEVRRLVSIVGEDALTEADRRFLVFADRFEHELIHQGGEHRTIEQTLAKGWDLLRMFPRAELTRIGKEFVERYYPAIDEVAAGFEQIMLEMLALAPHELRLRRLGGDIRR